MLAEDNHTEAATTADQKTPKFDAHYFFIQPVLPVFLSPYKTNLPKNSLIKGYQYTLHFCSYRSYKFKQSATLPN